MKSAITTQTKVKAITIFTIVFLSSGGVGYAVGKYIKADKPHSAFLLSLFVLSAFVLVAILLSSKKANKNQ